MKYKTESNLQKTWTHIDNALSEINLAYEMLLEMNLEAEELKTFRRLIDSFDESHLVAMKNEIEELIEKKKEKS